MKRLIAVAIVFTFGFAVLAQAALKPHDYRRTLEVRAGQRTLLLEAPRGMCFLDRTSYGQDMMFRTFSAAAEKKGGQVLLAVFADCHGAIGVGAAGILPGIGLVSWLNPLIGETTEMGRADYLDMREASFPQYVENGAGGLKPEGAVHRTEYSVSQGMAGVVATETEEAAASAVVATTSIRNIPVEVTLRFAGSDPPALDNVHALVDKFIAQQIALNG